MDDVGGDGFFEVMKESAELAESSCRIVASFPAAELDERKEELKVITSDGVIG